MKIEKCHCGRALHYESRGTRELVEEQIRELGPTVKIMVGDRAWEVPRHYIALHGLRACDVGSLGFKEVEP